MRTLFVYIVNNYPWCSMTMTAEQMFGPWAVRNAGEKIIKCYDWIISYQLHNYTCPNYNGPKKLQPSELIIS